MLHFLLRHILKGSTIALSLTNIKVDNTIHPFSFYKFINTPSYQQNTRLLLPQGKRFFITLSPELCNFKLLIRKGALGIFVIPTDIQKKLNNLLSPTILLPNQALWKSWLISPKRCIFHLLILGYALSFIFILSLHLILEKKQAHLQIITKTQQHESNKFRSKFDTLKNNWKSHATYTFSLLYKLDTLPYENKVFSIKNKILTVSFQTDFETTEEINTQLQSIADLFSITHISTQNKGNTYKWKGQLNE